METKSERVKRDFPVKNTIFVINHWTPEEYDAIVSFDGYQYMIVAKEVGDSGTPHLQGYLQLKVKKRWSTLKKVDGFARAHFERAKGTAKQNMIYCCKGNQPKSEWELFKDKGPNYGVDACFEEFGEMTKQGQREDLKKIKLMVKEGKPLKEIWDKATGYQAYKMGEIGKQFYQDKRCAKPEVLWFYGPTGSGKTSGAFKYLEHVSEGEDIWISNGDLIWWEGYVDQRYVILDDFRASHCMFSLLLRYLDRYPIRVPIKGGSRPLLATHIIVTSPFHPKSVYKEREDIGQLLRRIDRVEKFELLDGFKEDSWRDVPENIDDESKTVRVIVEHRVYDN